MIIRKEKEVIAYKGRIYYFRNISLARGYNALYIELLYLVSVIFKSVFPFSESL